MSEGRFVRVERCVHGHVVMHGERCVHCEADAENEDRFLLLARTLVDIQRDHCTRRRCGVEGAGRIGTAVTAERCDDCPLDLVDEVADELLVLAGGGDQE